MGCRRCHYHRGTVFNSKRVTNKNITITEDETRMNNHVKDGLITFTSESLNSPVSLKLITALNAELLAAYNGDATTTSFSLSEEETAPGQGLFLIARLNSTPIACGAIRKISAFDDDTTAEIKRMYVVPSARGTGVGAQMVQALEEAARNIGIKRLVLETGTKQVAAQKMYLRQGYHSIGKFGDYISKEIR